MGELVIQNEGFDARVKDLEKDPIVEEMARRIANDPGERLAAQVNKNAGDLGRYLKAKYRQIQQEKSNDLDRELEEKHREIENLQKEHRKLEQGLREKGEGKALEEQPPELNKPGENKQPEPAPGDPQPVI